MTSKSQQKKQARLAETKLRNEITLKIQAAEEIEDYLADLQSFRKFNKNGIVADVLSFSHTPNQYLDWMFDLTKSNMKELYEQTWGWSDSKKRGELTDKTAHFIILVTPEGPAGFLHFRFFVESSMPVLYIMEIQVDPKYQGKGIGKQMMMTAEFIALKRRMDAVMLTVFNINVGARHFYEKLHYQVHESTPTPGSNGAVYQIMYKSLKK